MTDSPIPAWIYKRDGRMVPFEADKISRALFAASEYLGRPDAFLARELTDGVVHFLACESEGAIPTTAQVAELTAKVVRELGQPALAQAFADFAGRKVKNAEQIKPEAEMTVRFSAAATPSTIVQACLRTYSLAAVFARDLVAAHRDGLLDLTGLETPFELAGCVLGPISAKEPGFSKEPGSCPPLLEAIEETRPIAGGLVAVDGPEYSLAQHADDTTWAAQIRSGAWYRPASCRPACCCQPEQPHAAVVGRRSGRGTALRGA